MIIVTANLELLSFPSEGQLHQARSLLEQRWRIDNLVAPSFSLDGVSNGLRCYGCRGVRQLPLRLSDHTRTKRFFR